MKTSAPRNSHVSVPCPNPGELGLSDPFSIFLGKSCFSHLTTENICKGEGVGKKRIAEEENQQHVLIENSMMKPNILQLIDR